MGLQTRAEREQYLRELESGGPAEGLQPPDALPSPDVQLLAPEAGFVIKSYDATTSHRHYINICLSDKAGI